MESDGGNRDGRAYGAFAQVYDLFMDNVPYGEWSGYIIAGLAERGVTDGAVAELGCGTGKMTRLLRRAGYDMIGVDNSEEMLSMARARWDEENEDCSCENPESGGRGDILYLHQDMREFELYGTVRAVISVCDAVNYLLDEDDLRATFFRVRKYLDADGVFLFDMNTEYKYRVLLGNRTISENRDEAGFIWENEYDGKTRVNEYDLTLFVREKGDLYRKYEEIHYQRAYPAKRIETLLREAGFENVKMYDAYTKNPVRPDSGRISIFAYGGKA